jgi:hypothetical protein
MARSFDKSGLSAAMFGISRAKLEEKWGESTAAMLAPNGSQDTGI